MSFLKNKIAIILLSLILILGLALRLYKINIPLADHHSWRQADTAAVARNFIKEGFDFFHPRIDNMTIMTQSGLPNPERLFLVEPPIYQTIIAGFYHFFGVNEALARLVSILFSLGAIVFLYLLVKVKTNQWIGLLSAFFMAVLPYSIFYSRVVLPEPMMLFAITGMFYFFNRWLDEQDLKIFLIAVFFTVLAMLTKSFPLFLVLPLFYLVFAKWQWDFLKQKKLWLLVALSILPLIGWRLWISNFPEGIPSNMWLFNLGGIRFRPAFFRWLFAERMGNMILGYWGLALLVLGLALKPFKKEGLFFHWWFLAFIVYLFVFAAGNVTHDYYQIPFIPIASIFLAKGSWWLIKAPSKYFSKFLSLAVLAICLVFMLAFSWFEIRGFYLIQGGVDLAGKAVDELTDKNSLVLTGDSNDVTLLYNTNRYGWTGGYASYFPNEKTTIERVKSMGGNIYVTTKFEPGSEFGRYMLEKYQVIKQTDQYIIFAL